MKVVFIGYRSWAYEIAKKLIKSENKKWKISAIITTNSKEAPFERLNKRFYLINPTKKGQAELLDILQQIKPRVVLIYGWSWFIAKEIYEKYECLILHTSPLPKYRGGSPLQHQIINGETKSSVTIFKADKGIDTGDIYLQEPFSLLGDMSQIFEDIVKAGTKASIKVLDGIFDKKLTPVPQDNSKATYFQRRTRDESELKAKDFQNKSAKEIYNFIRSLGDPYPNAYIVCGDGKKLYIKSVKIES